MKSGEIPSRKRVVEDDIDAIPVFLMGDPAYPMVPYVMKEYANGRATGQEQYFGLKLCQARMVIECLFRQMKACFGALSH